MSTLKFEYLDVDKLLPYINNAKKHGTEQIKKIAASIKEFGFLSPCIIDKSNTLIAGHGRVQAAKLAGLQEIPCVRVEHLTEQQRKAYTIADNRLSEIDVSWDYELLKLELADLQLHDYDFKITGFDDLNLGEFSSGDGNDIDGSKYTKKIDIPIYTPKGEKPNTKELYDTSKSEQLKKEIEKANLPEDVKEFLEMAALRHLVFDYGKIAEFYCHAEPETQALMERSALVIIDFDKAIENGFVKLTEELAEAFANEE